VLSLDDDELQILMRAVVPTRDQFLRALSNELMQRPLCSNCASD
jgi:hypothetical protein